MVEAMSGFEITYTLRNVFVGASMLGVIGGILGAYAFLRRQSLVGDALAHAALPGVCIAFLLTGSKSSLALLGGALVAGITGALFILLIIRWTRVKEDSAIGIVLSVFFAVGIVLLTIIQKLPDGNQAGLDKFLFGQAATLVESDLWLMAILGVFVLAIVVTLFKEFQIVTFDREFARASGYPVRAIEMGMTCLLVLVVVVGLQTVGVVLMVAALVTPAAAARQWTERLGVMIIVSAMIGGFSGAAGAVASASVAHLPTGPTIVLISSFLLAISLLFAPRRGLVWARLEEGRVHARIRRENLLKDFFVLSERSSRANEFISQSSVMGVRGRSGGGFERVVGRLINEGLVQRLDDDFRLTDAGLHEAGRIVRKHRLWEVFLAKRLELPVDHVHRDAEMMEHALTDAAVDDLDAKLGFPVVDPHGRIIPRIPRPNPGQMPDRKNPDSHRGGDGP